MEFTLSLAHTSLRLAIGFIIAGASAQLVSAQAFSNDADLKLFAVAQRLFPQAQQLPHGVKLLALIGADGSPLMLTASKEAAIANAWEHELKTVSLHWDGGRGQSGTAHMVTGARLWDW